MAAKVLTAKAVADALGITPQRVRMLAQARGIGQQIERGVWLFMPDDVERLRPGPRGRRPKEGKVRYKYTVTSYLNAQQPPYDEPKRFMFAVEDTETGGIVHEEHEFLSYDAALNAARDYIATLRPS